MFSNQVEANESLSQCACTNRISVVISGAIGAGKTYLANKYAKMTGCIDVISAEPKVQEVCEAMSLCFQCTNKVALIIENIECGSLNASNAILKFLEDRPQNITVIITSRDSCTMLGTISSRCVSVFVPPLSHAEVMAYLECTYPAKSGLISGTDLEPCIKNISDADSVCRLDNANIAYLCSIKDQFRRTDTVSTISWKLTKFPDSSDVPINLSISMAVRLFPMISRRLLDCLCMLQHGRIGKSAIASYAAFAIKTAL